MSLVEKKIFRSGVGSRYFPTFETQPEAPNEHASTTLWRFIMILAFADFNAPPVVLLEKLSLLG